MKSGDGQNCLSIVPDKDFGFRDAETFSSAGIAFFSYHEANSESTEAYIN